MDEAVEQRLTAHQCVRDGRVSYSMDASISVGEQHRLTTLKGERFIPCHDELTACEIGEEWIIHFIHYCLRDLGEH